MRNPVNLQDLFSICKIKFSFCFRGLLKIFRSCFLQTQFLSSGSTGAGQWVVPVTLCCCAYSRQEKFLFHGKQEDFDLSGLGLTECQKNCSFWIKLNVNQTSFYRVSYDDELASRLRYAIETNKLSAADRYGKFCQNLISSEPFLPRRTGLTLLLFKLKIQVCSMMLMPSVWLANKS